MSKHDYLNEMVAFNGGPNRGFAPIFEGVKNELEPFDEAAPMPNYTYIHLRDGQMMTPGQHGMPQGGMLIRLVRSDIIGWSMGKLSSSQA
jgi:hypothetical protein